MKAQLFTMAYIRLQGICTSFPLRPCLLECLSPALASILQGSCHAFASGPVPGCSLWVSPWLTPSPLLVSPGSLPHAVSPDCLVTQGSWPIPHHSLLYSAYCCLLCYKIITSFIVLFLFFPKACWPHEGRDGIFVYFTH